MNVLMGKISFFILLIYQLHRGKNMGRSREKVKNPGPDEWKIAREYIFRYIHGGRNELKLASTIIHKGKLYEAFIVIKERSEK
jgi:hypothetical protein